MRRILSAENARRAFTIAVGSLGLLWGISALASSEASDELRDAESRLLHSDSFGREASKKLVSSQILERISACDTHSQRALLLMEMPLAEAALRAGAGGEFDQYVQSLEDRSVSILSCTPRQSFAWLVMFDLAILHGRLNDKSFMLLEKSYEASPNEAWISVRRTFVSLPVLLSAPEPIQSQILDEFQHLIATGFAEEAARAYLYASEPTRKLLQIRIDRLEVLQRKTFSDAVRRISS